MKIHGYEIVNVINGGMANVFHCVRPDGLHVALKQVRPDKAQNNPSLYSKFAKATDILLKQLQNGPYIVKAYAVYNDEETQTTLLEMEWVDGVTLDEYAKNRRETGHPLSKKEIKEIARQILEGLKFAHNKNILHLDIKPKNIMLVDGTVRIIDFGIAKVIGENAGIVHGTNSKNTTTNGETGTSNWFSGFYSPTEQRLGRKMNASTDLYALGRTLHVVITGEEDEDLQVNDPELAAFIEKCTAKQKDRFQSAQEALDALTVGGNPKTKECRNCHTWIPVGAKFCPFCGTEFKIVELKCVNGHKMEPGQKFCCQCGGPLATGTTPKPNSNPAKIVGYRCSACGGEYRDRVYGDSNGVKFCNYCGASKDKITLLYE